MREVNRFFGMMLALLGLVVSCVGVDDGLDKHALSGEVARMAVGFRVSSEQLSGAPSSLDGAPGSYSIADPGVSTDEGTAQGYTPRDVWIIQYAGTTDQAPLVGLPQYAQIHDPATIIQAVASIEPNTLIFIANTHDANLEFGDISTLGKMNLACQMITSEEDCYGDDLYGAKDLMFSGKFEGVINNSTISVRLFRNIVRLDFTLENAVGSSMTIRSIQLCNVPSNLYYAEGAAVRGGIFPAKLDFIDYPVETVAAAGAEGGSQSFTFYMPSNQRGVVSTSTSAKTKPTYAPSYATHFRIVAMDAHRTGYVYKIYPGANVVNDYNLLPNNRYAVKLSVNASGDASTDGRLEFYGKTDFTSSNSFILHPAPEGAADRIFTIPIDKVNEYWQAVDPTLTISPGDQWTVELIWQDAANSDFIRFVDLDNGQLQTTFSGIGPTERFAVTTKSGYEGNALIGLKKVGRQGVGYLWSWHLWVTDYDPEYRVAPVKDQLIYSVPGGCVHRYRGSAWDNKGGLYFDKYIMDRNLGARNDRYTTIGMLSYQFGRKDPLPCRDFGNVLYDINGTTLSPSDPRNAACRLANAGVGVTLATGVLNPVICYYREASSGGADWTSEGKIGAHAWNHPVVGAEIKSIFDPCPSGWKVPHHTVWENFRYEKNTPATATVMNTIRDSRLGWMYNNTAGGRYWPLDQEIVGEIHYPAVGFRATASGVMTSVAGQSICWASLAQDVNNGRDLNLFVNTCAKVWDRRSYGFSVRCVQQ